MSKRDKALSELLRERASVCRLRGDHPSAKVMFSAANRLAQIEREERQTSVIRVTGILDAQVDAAIEGMRRAHR